MKYLSEEEMLELVGEKVADYTKEIYMFVPLSGDQPVVMYTSLFRGIPSKHYLGLELKLKYSGGLYVYKPESKQFDITQHEWSDEAKDCRILFNNPSWAGDDLQIEISDVNGSCVDALLIKEHAIAIAKHFKLTAEDLK